jgi:N-acetylneuraminic acid mutarotase
VKILITPCWNGENVEKGLKMKKTILFILALSLVTKAAKADYIWAQKADMPTSRWELSTSAVNGKIYAIGGRKSEPDNVKFSTVEEYDPATDAWTQKTDMPTPRSRLSTCVVDNRIYAIGGSPDGFSTVEEYDPTIDTWTRKTDMPTPRRNLATCTVNGKIYAIGGTPQGNLSGLMNVEEYDPATDTWRRKANMLTGVWGLCACAVNGKIYAIGGRPDLLVAIPNVQEYDPATDTWVRKANMPVGTSSMASVVLGEKIVVIGGWLHSNNPPYTTLQIYDPKEDTWTIENETPFLKACFSASVVNNRIYAIGGTDRPHPCPATSTVYVYDIIVDFHGDGIVNAADMCIMVDYWGTDDHLCDIAPEPFGDGIVDVQDLIVVAEHLFEEVLPIGLVAYWKLGEAEGSIAEDTAGDNDGIVYGDAFWQPEGGVKAGALQLDGIEDYISTDFVLNPADGPFSVFAWVNSSVPGSVVISQLDGIGGSGETWLGTEAVSGKLMTGLVAPPVGRFVPKPLISESVITDGQWHNVGFVWDGSTRSLYVDDILVAEDTQTNLQGSDNGLFIGTSKSMEPGTCWSGLIDDVRIYNRAIRP